MIGGLWISFVLVCRRVVGIFLDFLEKHTIFDFLWGRVISNEIYKAGDETIYLIPISEILLFGILILSRLGISSKIANNTSAAESVNPTLLKTISLTSLVFRFPSFKLLKVSPRLKNTARAQIDAFVSNMFSNSVNSIYFRGRLETVREPQPSPPAKGQSERLLCSVAYFICIISLLAKKHWVVIA